MAIPTMPPVTAPPTPAERPQGLVLRLSGELDLGTQADFGTALSSASGDPDRPWLVVDLRDVTFMDCTGLRALCAARLSCRSREPAGWVRLVYTAPAIGRLLSAAGLQGAFPRYASVHDARRGVPTLAHAPRITATLPTPAQPPSHRTKSPARHGWY